MCCSALQCVTVRYNVVQCGAVWCSYCRALPCVAVRCRALPCVAVCCSALQCVALRRSASQCVAVRRSSLKELGKRRPFCARSGVTSTIDVIRSFHIHAYVCTYDMYIYIRHTFSV